MKIHDSTILYSLFVSLDKSIRIWKDSHLFLTCNIFDTGYFLYNQYDTKGYFLDMWEIGNDDKKVIFNTTDIKKIVIAENVNITLYK